MEKFEEILEKDIEDLTDEEVRLIENRIEELEQEIEQEEKKLDVCGYGKEDLYYVEGLMDELEELRNKIYE